MVFFGLIGLLQFCNGASALDVVRPKNVVFLFSAGTALPAYDVVYQRIVETIQREAPGPVNVYAEYLDLGRFHSESYHRRLFDLYREKYAEKKIDLVILVGRGASEAVDKHGQDLFSNISTLILRYANPFSQTPSFNKPFATGIFADLDVKGSLETALSLQPATRTVFVISGASADDQYYEAIARAAYQGYEASIRIEYLSGLSAAKLLDQVATLPPKSAVIFLSFSSDVEGQYIYPKHVVRLVAEKSNAPVYSIFGTYMGEGIVGGHLVDFHRAGDEAGRLALRLLRGEPADAIPAVRGNYHAYMFDGRQLKRWGIDEEQLPAGSKVSYREAALSAKHMWYFIGLILFAIVETTLLVSLILLHRKKEKTEKMLHLAESRYREMLRFERISRLGQLVTSLAHELKQPLASILGSAQAAMRFLRAEKVDLDLVQQLLGSIVRDEKRAANVITTLQAMVKREENAREPVLLNSVVDNVAAVFMSEANQSALTIEKEFDKSPCPVLGCAAQLEQVVLNLIMNAGDAVSQCPPEKRRVVLQTKTADHWMRVTVRDFGSGIDEAIWDKLFQPFFTTKKSGMGMGLAICKSIIVDHGGRIWAENHPEEGALFCFELPAHGNGSG